LPSGIESCIDSRALRIYSSVVRIIPKDRKLPRGQSILKKLGGRGVVTARAPEAPSPGVPRGGSGANVHHKIFNGPGDSTNRVIDYLGDNPLTTAQLRLVFWGSQWGLAPVVPHLEIVADVESIVGGPYLDAAQQYGVESAWVDRVVLRTDVEPPNPVSGDDVADLIKDMIDNGTFPEPDDDQTTPIYVVFLPGQSNGMPLQIPAGVIGSHSNYIYWDYDFPIDIDISNIYVAWVSGKNRQDFSATFSHELVETMTDPSGSSWQVEPTDSSNWNEVGDVCASTMLLNGVNVQSYWSQMDNACVIPDTLHTTYTVQWIYRPDHIEWLGGIDQDGRAWQFTREMVMIRIRAGDQFIVKGASRTSTVGIYYLDARHPYLATNMDGASDDNLLSLPQHPPS